MLRKTLIWSQWRPLLATNRLMSSQVVKPIARVITKGDEQTSVVRTGSTRSGTDGNDVTARMELNEIMERVIKNEKTMDRVWELHQTYHEKPHNEITDLSAPVDRPFKDFYTAITFYPWDFSWPGIKRRLKLWIKYREQNQQQLYPKRHADLGPDLAIANFVIHRGGRVLFSHATDKWATSLRHFPRKYDPRYRVVSVDASNLKLRWEAIDNFIEADSLTELDLSNNFLDDWSCDKLSRVFRSAKLSSLNLSNNPLITHRGIESLHWIRSLKTLTITGTKAAKYPFLELLVANFNDLVPECRVIGD